MPKEGEHVCIHGHLFKSSTSRTCERCARPKDQVLCARHGHKFVGSRCSRCGVSSIPEFRRRNYNAIPPEIIAMMKDKFGKVQAAK